MCAFSCFSEILQRLFMRRSRNVIETIYTKLYNYLQNCKDGTTGDYCDECLEGYTGDPANGIPCTYRGTPPPCNCDPRGSVSTECRDGRCICKVFLKIYNLSYEFL